MTNVVRLRAVGATSTERPDMSAHATVPVHTRYTGSYPYISPTPSMETSFPPDVWEVEVETSISRAAKKRQAKQFLLGPIPVALLAVLGRLPGRAWLVWFALKYRSDTTGSREMTLPISVMATFGLDRFTRMRGLRELEAAGLVQVVRQKGRAARVSLVGMRCTDEVGAGGEDGA